VLKVVQTAVRKAAHWAAPKDSRSVASMADSTAVLKAALWGVQKVETKVVSMAALSAAHSVARKAGHWVALKYETR
jgi:hypothetical protein